jgi:hypothetical protein
LLFGAVYFFINKDKHSFLVINNLICLAVCFFKKREVI